MSEGRFEFFIGPPAIFGWGPTILWALLFYGPYYSKGLPQL